MAAFQYARIFLLMTLCAPSFGFSSVDDCPIDKLNHAIMIYYEDDCFYFHMRHVSYFKDASTVCWREGGTLAMPKTDVISRFLNVHIGSYDARGATWVGLIEETKRDAPSEYTWADGESVEYKYAKKILQYGVPYSYFYDRQNGTLVTHDEFGRHYFVCQIKGPKNKTQEISTTTTTTTTTATTSTPATTTITTNTQTQPREETYFCPVIRKGQPYMRFFGESCFYFQVESKSYYNTSKSFCERYGGSLARVKTSVVELFLQYTLKYDLKVPEYSVWIGLETVPETGQYIWADGSQVTYINFRYSFPVDNSRFAMSGIDDKWDSFSTDTRKNYICEFKSRVNSLP